MSRTTVLTACLLLCPALASAAVPAGWQPLDALGGIDVTDAQPLARALDLDLATGAGAQSCPANAWTGAVTYRNTSRGQVNYWGTGVGCLAHGVGTLQFADGSTYFGRVTSFLASRSAPFSSAGVQPAVPDGPGQLFMPAQGQQQIGLFARGLLAADRSSDAAFTQAYQAAYASVADRAAPRLTPALAALFDLTPASGGVPALPPAMGVSADGVLFPAHLPRLPEFEKIEKWAARVESDDWEPEARAEIERDGSVKGWRVLKTMFGDMLSNCDKVGKQGVIVVEDKGQAKDGFKRYRGGWGGCGPAGNGIIEYADGKRYIGQVKSDISPGTTFNYRPHGLGLWQYANGRRVLVQFDHGVQRGLLAFGAPGEWWAEGKFDGQWNTADGVYHAADGSEFRGALKDARPGGSGVWDDRRGLQVGGEARMEEEVLVFGGAMEFVLGAPLKVTGGTLPPGNYHYADPAGWRVGAPLPAERLVPAVATIAKGSARGRCGVQATPPQGWSMWWASCHDGEQGLQVMSYAPDGRLQMRHTARGATLSEVDPAKPTRALRSWHAAAFDLGRVPTPRGAARLELDGVVQYEGPFAGLEPDGQGLCAQPADEGKGVEPCEFRGGQRVDQLHHLRQQRLAMARAQQQAAQVAEQQRIAAIQAQQRAAAQAAAQQAAQQKQGGFQWGKFAAMAVAGGAASAAGRLDGDANMKILEGIVKDSVAGTEGMGNLQAAANSMGVATTTPSLGGLGGYGGGLGAAMGSGGSTASGQGAVPAGSYPARPNTLSGHPACSGYTVDNYKQFFAQNSSGPDVQLHTMCAAAYNYYWMYLNAIRQGYSQADSDRTYAAFSDAARVATSFYESAR